VRGARFCSARVPATASDRLGTSADTWQAWLQKLSEGRLLGRFFAASRQRLSEVAERLALRRVANLRACAAT